MSNSKLVPVEVLELDDEAVDRLRRISERRRLDEYSDDSQVYIGDIFPKDLEDIVP